MTNEYKCISIYITIYSLVFTGACRHKRYIVVYCIENDVLVNIFYMNDYYFSKIIYLNKSSVRVKRMV